MAHENWPRVRLETIAATDRKAFAMGPFGSNIKSENYQPTGVPVLRGVNLGDGGFSGGELVFLSEEKAEELKHSQAFPNDLVFVAQGTVGRVALVPNTPRFQKTVLSQNLMKFSCDSAKADSRFLYYFFISSDGQQTIRSRVNPTGVPCISRPLSSLKEFEVTLPPLAEQEAIAAVLGALDDKIELNRRMNATLEAMGRALFQSWFVDFDPVRAKLDGRQPLGLDRAIAALFPGSFQRSQFGSIPEGWSHTTLAEICSKVTDGAHQSPKSVEAGFPMASVKDMTDWEINIQDCRHVSEVDFEALVANGCQPELGDILLAKDGATCLDTACEYQQPEKIVLLSSVAILRPKHSSDSAFLHTWLGLSSTKTYLKENFVSGSAIPRVVLRDMKRAQLISPPRNVLDVFSRAAAPLREQIRHNHEQSRTLATLRDTLLPKLLNGELSVAGTERVAS